MTLAQVKGLCAGIMAREKIKAARAVHSMRLAMHGSDDDVTDYFDAMDGRDYDAEMDDILAKYQGGGDG